MYNNIGDKIKTLSEVVAWIDIIASIIIGVSLLSQSIIGVGLIVIILGSFIGWILSQILYGFGELIELTQENNNINKKLLDYYINKDSIIKHKDKGLGNMNLKIQNINQIDNTDSLDKNEESNIIDKVNYVEIICPNCGELLSFEQETIKDKNIIQCPYCDKDIKFDKLT